MDSDWKKKWCEGLREESKRKGIYLIRGGWGYKYKDDGTCLACAVGMLYYMVTGVVPQEAEGYQGIGSRIPESIVEGLEPIGLGQLNSRTSQISGKGSRTDLLSISTDGSPGGLQTT